jgi:curved DNA-binding protein CbpA
MDPYRTLQVDPTAEGAVIQAAYRALMKRHHPDRGGDPVLASRINQAYALLRDAESRRAWDRLLQARPGSGAERPAPAPPSAPEPGPAPALLVDLGPTLLTRFAPAPSWGPGWLFDFAGALRGAPRHRLWVRRFSRRDRAEARAFLTMVAATRMARPWWSWGSDLFVAVVPALTDCFAATLRAPRGLVPGLDYAVGVLSLATRSLHLAPGPILGSALALRAALGGASRLV